MWLIFQFAPQGMKAWSPQPRNLSFLKSQILRRHGKRGVLNDPFSEWQTVASRETRPWSLWKESPGRRLKISKKVYSLPVAYIGTGETEQSQKPSRGRPSWLSTPTLSPVSPHSMAVLWDLRKQKHSFKQVTSPSRGPVEFEDLKLCLTPECSY